MRTLLAALAALLLFFAPARAETALASWYGPGFERHKMADGARFSSADPTIAAHRTFPFGTRLRITNLENGRSLVVIVQDRGPFAGRRSLDLSRAAARLLGFERQGLAIIDMEVLAPDPDVPVT